MSKIVLGGQKPKTLGLPNLGSYQIKIYLPSIHSIEYPAN